MFDVFASPDGCSLHSVIMSCVYSMKGSIIVYDLVFAVYAKRRGGIFGILI